MSSVADRLKVDKSELLDPSSNNAAVRLALAETHVIAETKKYFENVGGLPLSGTERELIQCTLRRKASILLLSPSEDRDRRQLFS